MYDQIIEVNNDGSIEELINNNVIFIAEDVQEVSVISSGVQGQKGDKGDKGDPGTGFYDDLPDFTLIFDNKLV